MRTIGMIDVTDAPLPALVRAAYNPSRPQGLGYLHYQQGDLSDDEVARIISRANGHVALSMDYVNGRSCKFTVFQHDGRRYISNDWYDHNDAQLRSLLDGVGLSGALVDSARAEKAAYDEQCMSDAVAFLVSRGGSFKQNRWSDKNPDEVVPTNIDAGFYVGKYKGVIAEDYLPDGITNWSLVA